MNAAQRLKAELTTKFSMGDVDKASIIDMAQQEKLASAELAVLRSSTAVARDDLEIELQRLVKEHRLLLTKRDDLDRSLLAAVSAHQVLATAKRKAEELFSSRSVVLEYLTKHSDALTDTFLGKITRCDLRLGPVPAGELVPLVEGSFELAAFRLQQVGTGLYSDGIYGPYKVNIGWNVGRVGATLCVTATGPSHPHISSRDVCMGDSGIAITQAFTSGDILTGLGMLVNVLTYYNPASAYSHPEKQAGSPWSGLVCVECNELDIICVCHKEAATFCSMCLRKGPVSHCGSCHGCCNQHHKFSTVHLSKNSGLNNSGCIRR